MAERELYAPYETFILKRKDISKHPEKNHAK